MKSTHYVRVVQPPKETSINEVIEVEEALGALFLNVVALDGSRVAIVFERTEILPGITAVDAVEVEADAGEAISSN